MTDLILKLVKAIDDPAWIQHVVDYLYSIDVSGFAYTVPHANKDREDVITESLSSTELWWRDSLPPAGVYPIDVLYRHYCRMMEDAGEHPASKIVFGRSAPMNFGRPRVRTESFRFRPFYSTISGSMVRAIDVLDCGQENDYTVWATGEAAKPDNRKQAELLDLMGL